MYISIFTDQFCSLSNWRFVYQQRCYITIAASANVHVCGSIIYKSESLVIISMAQDAQQYVLLGKEPSSGGEKFIKLFETTSGTPAGAGRVCDRQTNKLAKKMAVINVETAIFL
jgi:hypothetical protein